MGEQWYMVVVVGEGASGTMYKNNKKKKWTWTIFILEKDQPGEKNPLGIYGFLLKILLNQ